MLKPDELSYALGKKGMTRKKLARSSGCIVEYVGHTVFMAGEPDERKRALFRADSAWYANISMYFGATAASYWWIRISTLIHRILHNLLSVGKVLIGS